MRQKPSDSSSPATAALSSVIHNAEYSPTSLNRAAADLTLSTDLREDHNQCNAQLQGSLHVISYDYVLCLLTVNTDLAYCAHRFLIVKALVGRGILWAP